MRGVAKREERHLCVSGWSPKTPYQDLSSLLFHSSSIRTPPRISFSILQRLSRPKSTTILIMRWSTSPICKRLKDEKKAEKRPPLESTNAGVAAPGKSSRLFLRGHTESIPRFTSHNTNLQFDLTLRPNNVFELPVSMQSCAEDWISMREYLYNHYSTPFLMQELESLHEES
jgi:hypothetical protein